MIWANGRLSIWMGCTHCHSQSRIISINLGISFRLWMVVLHVCHMWRSCLSVLSQVCCEWCWCFSHTSKTCTTCPQTYFAPHFEIFSFLRAWRQYWWPCSSECCDFIYIFRCNKNWKIITLSDTRVTSVIETYATAPSWRAIRSALDIRIRDVGHQRFC
jgi:hypothetical protein